MIRTQGDLFDRRYPTTPGFKERTTSQAAAASMEKSAGKLQADVLAQLRKGDATADEVAAALGVSVLAIRPRFTELKAGLKIVSTTQRRPNVSGRMARVWSVAP